MPRQTPSQKETVERVMHEFKTGELHSRGTGPKVTNPKQAIAIALHEAGASNREDEAHNRTSFARAKAKERAGDTAEAEREGKAAQDRTLAKGARGGRSVEAKGRETRQALYDEARRRGVPGRSRMTKAQLAKAVRS